MKWVAFLLVLANGAYFGWHWYQEQATEPQPAPTDRGGLVLLSELSQAPASRTSEPPTPASPAPGVQADTDAQPRPAAEAPEPVEPVTPPSVAPEPAAPVDPAPTPVCFTASGLPAEAAASRLAGQLTEQFPVTASVRPEQVAKQRYWVMLPPFETAAAAQPVLDSLRAKGVEDYYLVRSGENRNAISLGVFSQRQSAERRYRRLRELGFTPRLEEINLPSQRFRIDLQWPDAPADGAWRDLAAEAGAEVRSVPCPPR